MAATLSTRMMMKKAASSLIPLANRTTLHRNYTSAISNSNPNNLYKQVLPRASSVPAHHHFSVLVEKISSSDDTLISGIQSEIDEADKIFGKVAKASRVFPFKFNDDPTEHHCITLTREYEAEEIKVGVDKPYFYRDKEEGSDPQYVNLKVHVLKKTGTTLNFDVKADVDGITIEYMEVLEPNDSDGIGYFDRPDFSKMDENFKKSFYTYLEVRGIEANISKFLCDYMVQRVHKKKSAWYNNLKNFIAN